MMYQAIPQPGDIQYQNPYGMQQEMYQRAYMPQPINMYPQYQYPNYSNEADQMSGYPCIILHYF